MKFWQKALAALLGLGAIAALCIWAWSNWMELRWGPVNKPSEAMQKNRMHVATLLLKQRGHPVKVVGTLGEAPISTLPAGTLIMAGGFGNLAPDQARQLLAWVGRGNTLISQPRWISPAEADTINAVNADSEDEDEHEHEHEHEHAPEAADEQQAESPASASASASAASDDEADEAEEEEEEEDDDDSATRVRGHSGPLAALVESDPIAVQFGVRMSTLPVSRACLAKQRIRNARNKGKPATSCPAPIPECQADDMRYLIVPGTQHTLELETGRMALTSMPQARPPLWSDNTKNAVHVYGHGRGKVVMVATNYFYNGRLQDKDHAELLLALGALAGETSQVTIVQFFDVLPWYQLLWARFHMLMLAAAVLLALAMWAALRRFGPLLPDPALERRSLMEHIDASGAWLWKAPGGAELLLQAARDDTLTLLRRRVPGLMRLPENDLAAALAAACQLSQQHVQEALFHAPAVQPLLFARQIRTLQTLRTHHER
ncbi:DUF4350 domain-containing protein [Massilia sp. CF038]|uniref:DUF4350 domain-containing protein n=1 Tax=Massilia sp. CF038 TaxID=1881045 RepID=UPI00091C3673|nr:DUF4350 domain-containing protein [Massilia sp. CF038]SHH04676.1 hypothetical protein SAMN05428948_2495 [Massilia sp. CF038]